MALCLFTACDSPSAGSEPGPPASYVVSGSGQSAEVGATLPEPIRVRVLDDAERPVPDVVLTFAVTSGGGTLGATTATTDAEGYASTTWTLGTRTEPHRVEVTWTDQANVPRLVAVFTATALAAPPVEVLNVSPSLVAPVNTAPVDSAHVYVRDRFGNPVRGAAVQWTVTSGGGTVSPQGSVTDSAGFAKTRWTFGPTAGTQLLRAAAGVGSVQIGGTAQPGPAQGLSLVPGSLLFLGPGQSVRVYAAGKDAVGNVQRVPVISWESLDPAVAQVGASAGEASEGSVTATGVGETEIVARAAGGIVATIPVRVAAPAAARAVTNAVGVDVGGLACAVTSDQEGLCWGHEALIARPVPGVRFRSIAAGWSGGTMSLCGILMDDRVWCWFGSPFVAMPTRMSDAPFTQVAISHGYACGVSLGRVYCWGGNQRGQLGTGTTTPQTGVVPVSIPGNPTIASVSTAPLHACALTTGGEAFCWGSNLRGELGNTESACAGCPPALPSPVQGSLRFAAIGAGELSSCGVVASSDLYCWGSIQQYESQSVAPVRQPYSGFTRVSMGSTFGCGLVEAQRVACWRGDYPQFPTVVANGPFAGLAADEEMWYVSRVCGVEPSGGLYCLGNSPLGDGLERTYRQRSHVMVPVLREAP